MTAARAQGCKSRARIHPRFFCRTIDATHSGPRNSYVPGPSPKQLSPRSTHGRLLASASGDSSPCSPWLASGCTSDLTLWGPVAFCSHVPHRSRSLANRARRASAGRATPRLEALGGGSCIRGLEVSDRDFVVSILEQLGWQSRIQRFLAPRPILSERDLSTITTVDGLDRGGTIAFAGSSPIGAAHYVRTAAPEVAEIAVEVSKIGSSVVSAGRCLPS